MMWLLCRNNKNKTIIFNYGNILHVCVFLSFLNFALCLRKYTRKDVLKLREEAREMFQHAYNGYLNHAADYDELRPLSCDGVNTWGSYSLTLIDSLDTLAVMGNFTEFRRVVDILVTKSNFDSDINVSVFETNIRIVGGLIGAHLLQHRSGATLEPGWPCNGPLLRMAEDVAKRLLPAFDTKTGMPYGTVNLKYGVPENETSVTCTAGVGTFIVEFGALSRLTGDPIYEEVALNAIHSLYRHKSSIGLYGNHIDVQTGRWTGIDSGIGAGVDSFFEYLVKGSIMLSRPELMAIFNEAKLSIDKYLSKNDWHIWASMTKGQVTIPVFQSLDAYWPGVLSMIGDISNAMKSIYNYHSVWKQYGFLPEFYNIPNSEAGSNRESYPLRPELIESVMYLYRATGDSYLLEVGEDMLRSIQHSAKTPCGYATIKNVRDHRKENRMESFFLAETTKYLYMLFDPDNFLNNDGGIGTIIDTPNGECVIDTGGYIFNTEAHPIDPSALRCCYEMPDGDLIAADFTPSKYLGDIVRITLDEPIRPEMESVSITISNDTFDEKGQVDSEISRLTNIPFDNVNQWFSTDEVKNELMKFLNELQSKSKKDSAEDESKEMFTANVNDDIIIRAESPVSNHTDSQSRNISSAYDVVKNPTKTESFLSTIQTFNHSKKENDPKRKHIDETDEAVVEDEQEEIGSQSKMQRASIEKLSEPKIITPIEMDPSLKRKPFDAQRLIERVRKMYNDTNVTRNYELLSCKSQSFLQRLAVLGEILT